MPRATPAAADRYAALVQAFSSHSGVALGAGRKKGFAAGALAVHGKIFAMLSSRGRFVVKLPHARVDALVAAGTGRRFVPATGRVMKEWLEVADARASDWLALAGEAHAFVAKQA